MQDAKGVEKYSMKLTVSSIRSTKKFTTEIVKKYISYQLIRKKRNHTT